MAIYTMSEIARKTNIPIATLRYYRDRFPEYIHTIGEGRSRRYSDESIEALLFISECMRSNMPPEAIEEGLSAKFGRSLVQEHETAGPSATAYLTEMMSDVLEEMLNRQMEATKSYMESVVEENKRLREALDKREKDFEERLEKRDALLMETLRSLQESAAAQEEKKGFFKRLFG